MIGSYKFSSFLINFFNGLVKRRSGIPIQIRNLLPCICFGMENAVSIKAAIVMKKDIQKRSQFEVEWIGVPEIPERRTGVEFHYRTGDLSNQRYDSRGHGKIIGFIDGLGWLDKDDKDGHPVKVYFLSSESKQWGRLSSRAGEILSTLKECVFTVLEEKVNPEQIWHGEVIKANIFTRWNCRPPEPALNSRITV
ncbi:MAG: hypothetical protein ACUVWO_17610 [Thermodesulfobacteriota bacterium]